MTEQTRRKRIPITRPATAPPLIPPSSFFEPLSVGGRTSEGVGVAATEGFLEREVEMSVGATVARGVGAGVGPTVGGNVGKGSNEEAGRVVGRG